MRMRFISHLDLSVTFYQACCIGGVLFAAAAHAQALNAECGQRILLKMLHVVLQHGHKLLAMIHAVLLLLGSPFHGVGVPERDGRLVLLGVADLHELRQVVIRLHLGGQITVEVGCLRRRLILLQGRLQHQHAIRRHAQQPLHHKTARRRLGCRFAPLGHLLRLRRCEQHRAGKSVSVDAEDAALAEAAERVHRQRDAPRLVRLSIFLGLRERREDLLGHLGGAGSRVGQVGPAGAGLRFDSLGCRHAEGEAVVLIVLLVVVEATDLKLALAHGEHVVPGANVEVIVRLAHVCQAVGALRPLEAADLDPKARGPGGRRPLAWLRGLARLWSRRCFSVWTLLSEGEAGDLVPAGLEKLRGRVLACFLSGSSLRLLAPTTCEVQASQRRVDAIMPIEMSHSRTRVVFGRLALLVAAQQVEMHISKPTIQDGHKWKVPLQKEEGQGVHSRHVLLPGLYRRRHAVLRTGGVVHIHGKLRLPNERPEAHPHEHDVLRVAQGLDPLEERVQRFWV
eukprot:scaffold7639_cov258-Pinguiococcus_pyrenoidosus.AAC.7